MLKTSRFFWSSIGLRWETRLYLLQKGGDFAVSAFRRVVTFYEKGVKHYFVSWTLPTQPPSLTSADDEIARITQIASAAEEQAKSAETAAAEAKRTVVEVSKLLVEVDRRATAASSHYSRLVDGQHQGSRRIEANSTRLFRVAADLERLAETLRAATKLSGNAFEELQDRLINGAKNPPDIGLVESVAAPTTKSISPGRGESTRDQLDTRGKGRGGSTSHDVIAVEIADFEGEGHNHGGVLTSEDETKSATTRLLGISEKDTTETDENVQRREVTVGEGYNLVKLADEEMIDDIHFKKQSDSIAATSGHHGMFHRHCGEVMEENRLHAIRDLNCPRRPVCTGLSLVPGEGRAQLSTIPVRPLGSRSLSENATPHAWARMSCPVLPGTEAADESLRLLAEKTAATNRRGTTGYGQDQRSWTRCLLRQGRSMPVLEQYHTAAAEARKWTVERGGRENVYDMPATRVGSAVKFGKNGTGSSARTVTAEESEREEFQTDLADHHHPTAFSSSHVEKGCKLYFPTRPHSRKSDEESLVGEGDLSCGRVEGGGRASTCPRVTVTPSNILVCLGNASAGGSSRQPRTQPSTTPGEPRGPSDIGGGGVESGFEGSTLEAFSVSCERSVAMATKSTGSATDLAGDSFAVEAIFTEGGMGCFGGGTSGRSRGSRVRTKAPHSESNNAGVDGATTKCTTMYRNGTRLAFLESAPKLWCPRDTWTDDGQAVDANHEVSTSPTAPPHRYYQRRRSSIRVELSSHCS